MVTNGKPESPHVTNGVCDVSDVPLFVPAGGKDQRLTVTSSQKLPRLSAHDTDLASDAASEDGLMVPCDDGDVLNGNYMSSSEDQRTSPLSSISQSSEQPLQQPVTVDAARIGDESLPKHRADSSDEKMQSLTAATAAAATSTDNTVIDAVSPSVESEVFQPDEAVRDDVDVTSRGASVKAAPTDKQDSSLPASVESLITGARLEIPAARGALKRPSDDTSSLTIDKTGKLTFPAEEMEIVPPSDKVRRQEDRDSDGATERMPSTMNAKETAGQQEDTVTTSDDLTRKLPDTVVDEDTGAEPSSLADKLLPDDETATCISKEHDISSVRKEIRHEAEGNRAVVSVAGLKTHPSDVSQEHEDTVLSSSDEMDVQPDTNVETSSLTGEFVSDVGKTVPQPEVTSMAPAGVVSKPSELLPCADEGSSISSRLDDEDRTRESGIIAETAFNNSTAVTKDSLMDSGESNLSGSDGEKDLSVGLPGHDHYDDGLDDRNEDYDGDADKEDSDAEDDTTSLQVAPRSVKMRETAKGRQSGSTTSTVVCARPSRGRASKTPSTGGLPEGTEISHGGEFDEKKEPDGKEPGMGHGTDEKVPRSEHTSIMDDSPPVDLTTVTGDHRPPQKDDFRKDVHSPTSADETVQPCSTVSETNMVDRGTDDTQQGLDSGKSNVTLSFTQQLEEEIAYDHKVSDSDIVQDDSNTFLLHPSEEHADSEISTMPGSVAGHAPDLQGSLTTNTGDELPTISQSNITEQILSGRPQPQQPDSRPADAGLAVLRPWEIQQQTDAGDDDRKYITDEHPQTTALTGDGRSLPKDKADDTGDQSVSKAVKTGLMAVVAAPYIAGKVLADALRSDTSTTTSTPHSATRSDQRPSETGRTIVDSSSLPKQTSDTLEVKFRQPLTEPISTVAGTKQPDSSEIYDDRSLQASMKMEPLLPVVASTQPSESTVTTSLPSVVSAQPLTSTVGSTLLPAASTPLCTQITVSTAPSVVSAVSMDSSLSTVASMQPVTMTSPTSLPTVVSTLPSPQQSETISSTAASARPTEVAQQFSGPLVLDSTETVAETVKASLPVTSTAPSASATDVEMTTSAVTLTQTFTVTAQSVTPDLPSSEQFSQTPKSTLPSKESPAAPSLTIVSTGVALSQPLTTTAHYTASPLPSQPAIMTGVEVPASSVGATQATQAVPSVTEVSVLTREGSRPLNVTAAVDIAAGQAPPQVSLPAVSTVVPVLPTMDTTVSAVRLSQPDVGLTGSESVLATVVTVPLTAPSVLPTDSIVSSAVSSQPSMVTTQPSIPTVTSKQMMPDVQPTKLSKASVLPTPSTTALTEVSSEAVEAVPLTRPFTETTQFIPSTLVSTAAAGPVSSSVDSLQPAFTVTSVVTTASDTSSVVLPEQGFGLHASVSVSSQSRDVTSRYDLSSAKSEVTPHLKPSIKPSETSQLSEIPAREETGEGFIVSSLSGEESDKSPADSSMAVAPDFTSQEMLNEEKNIADEKSKQYKRQDVADTERSAASLVEWDGERSEFSYQPVPDRSSQFQPEDQLHYSEQSSVAGSIKAAVQTGLLGLVGAPVLAGMAIAGALRSKPEERQGVQTTGLAQGLSTDDVTVSQHELEPGNGDFKKHKTRSQEIGAEPDVISLQPFVPSSEQPPASAVIAPSGADHKYAGRQAAFPPVDDDQQKQIDADKEVKDKQKIAAGQPVVTDEIQYDLGRGIENTGLPGLSLSEALLSPLYDQQNNCFIDPTSGRRISISSAVRLGLIDGDKKMIADLSSGEVISVIEALNRGIINAETGMVSVDGEASVPLNEALASGLIMDDSDGDLLEMAASIGTAGGHAWNDVTDITDSVRAVGENGLRQSSRQLSQPLKLVQVLDLGLYNPLSGEFLDPRSSDSLSLAEAIRCRLLDKNSMVINDPQSEEVLSLEESICGGLVSGNTSFVHDTSTSEKIPLTEALRRGILVPRPMSIATAINIGLYDESNGMFFDPTNGLYFALEEAVEGGLIDPHSLVIDPATGKAMAVAAALACGVLDARHGNVVNIHTGEVIPLKQMAVSSQATFGGQPVGVSSQVAPAATDAEELIKPTTGRDMPKISDSRIVATATSQPSGDGFMTADDGVTTNHVRDDGDILAVSVAHDTSKIMKTTGVSDATGDVPDTSTDAVQGDKMQQHVDNVPYSSDIPADTQPSVDTELKNDITTLADDDHAGNGRQAESGKVQVEVPYEQPMKDVAEAAADESSGAPVCDESYWTPGSVISSETPVSGDSYRTPTSVMSSEAASISDDSCRTPASIISSGAPVSDDSYRTPGSVMSSEATVSDDSYRTPASVMSSETRISDDSYRTPADATSPICDESLRAPVGDESLQEMNRTVDSPQPAFDDSLPVCASASDRKPIVSEESGQPASVLASAAATSLSISRQFEPSVTVRPEDGGTPMSAVDGVSSTVTLPPYQQSSNGQFQPENLLHDSEQSSVAGSVKTAVQAGLLGLVGAPVLAGMAVADALRSKPSSVAAAVSDRPADTVDVTSARDVETRQTSVAGPLNAISDIFVDMTSQAESGGLQLPEGVHDRVGLDRLTQMESMPAHDQNIGQPQASAGPHNAQPLIEVQQINVKCAASDLTTSDGGKKPDLTSDDSLADDKGKRDGMRRDMKKDATEFVVQSQDDALQPSSTGQVEVKTFSRDELKKDTALKDEVLRDDSSEDDSEKDVAEEVHAEKDAQKIAESRDIEHLSDAVQISVKPLFTDDLEKHEVRKADSQEDGSLAEGTDRDVARKDEMQRGLIIDTEPSDQIQQLTSINEVEVKSLPVYDVKKAVTKKDEAKDADVCRDHSKRSVSSKDESQKEPANITEFQQQLSGILQVSATCDDGKGDGLTDDTSERDDGVTEGRTKKDETGDGFTEDTAQRDGVTKPRMKKDVSEDGVKTHDDVQQLSSIIHAEAKTPASGVSIRDDVTENVVMRDDVMKDGAKKDVASEDTAQTIAEFHELSTIIQVKAKTLPHGVGQRDDVRTDNVTDAARKVNDVKESGEEDLDGLQTDVKEFHDDLHQPTGIKQFEVKPLPGGDTDDNKVPKDELKKDVLKKDDEWKDATNIAESRDDVQQFSKIVAVEMKLLPEDVNKVVSTRDDDVDAGKGDEKKAKENEEGASNVVRLQDNIAVTEGYVADAKAAREIITGDKWKSLDEANTARIHEMHADADVDKQELVAMDTEQQQQQKFALGSEVLTEEKVLSARRDGDDLSAVKYDDSRPQEEDLTVTADRSVTARVLVSTSALIMFCNAVLSSVIFANDDINTQKRKYSETVSENLN